jgi:hypothetical protein
MILEPLTIDDLIRALQAVKDRIGGHHEVHGLTSIREDLSQRWRITSVQVMTTQRRDVVELVCGEKSGYVETGIPRDVVYVAR